MTYYDELGVSRTASPEEIREAYRQLVKLLHPDRYQNSDELRRLADLQLKRLNEIVAILGDPEKRRDYDQGVAREELRPPSTTPTRKSPARPQRTNPAFGQVPGTRDFVYSVTSAFNRWMWILTLLIGAGALGWYFATESAVAERPPALGRTLARNEAKPLPPPPEPEPAPEEAAPAASAAAVSPGPRTASGRTAGTSIPPSLDPPPAEKLRVLERRLRAARVDREQYSTESESRFAAELAQIEALAREEAPKKPASAEKGAVRAAGPASVAPTATPPAAEKTAQPQPAPQKAEPKSAFEGRWVYQPAPKKHDDGLFPPEFIELNIEARGDVVWGSYKAKYQVPTGRKIYPQVEFQFIGRPNKKSPQFLWSGDGGATGVVELKMVNDTAMEVNWTATNLGRMMGLVAGTAVLERQ